MSRIGKAPDPVPSASTSPSVADDITVKGPKGTLVA